MTEQEQAELLDALADMVRQYALPKLGQYLGSGSLSTVAEAMRLLARHGRMWIVRDDGHRDVVGAFIEKGKTSGRT